MANFKEASTKPLGLSSPKATEMIHLSEYRRHGAVSTVILGLKLGHFKQKCKDRRGRVLAAA